MNTLLIAALIHVSSGVFALLVAYIVTVVKLERFAREISRGESGFHDRIRLFIQLSFLVPLGVFSLLALPRIILTNP